MGNLSPTFSAFGLPQLSLDIYFRSSEVSESTSFLVARLLRAKSYKDPTHETRSQKDTSTGSLKEVWTRQ